MIDIANCRLELDGDGKGGSNLVHKLTQRRVRLRHVVVSLCLGARGARPAHFCVAPEVQGDADMDSVL